LDKLTGRDDVYSLVPLTQDKDVQDAFEAHCLGESTPENGRWRICWLNKPAETVLPVVSVSAVDGVSPVLATILDDPDAVGTQYTIVTSVGQEFLTAGVRPGDAVRALYQGDGFGNFAYSEFLVDAVVNNETIRLFSGPAAAVNVPSKIEIWRTLTRTETADNLATFPGLFRSRRAYLVWPDLIGNGGRTVPGYFLCCSLAGLRSGVLPHQGLTNVQILGWDDLTRTTKFFTATQLNVMAASGWWIVTRDPRDGTVFTRHELSTDDQTNNLKRRQMVTTNVDYISFTFLNRLKGFIGRGNATPTMLDIVRSEVIAVIEGFKNTIISRLLGPQLLASTFIKSIRIHPTLKDRILIIIDLDVPLSLDNIELHLQVNARGGEAAAA
jgi:hypothetical protein